MTEHTPSVKEVHVIYPFTGIAFEVECPCGYRSSTFKKRKEAVAWVEIHEQTMRAHEAALEADALPR